MDKRLTSRQQQAEETKARLIDSALKVFSAKGFSASTTKDIAREAGVTDGLIYHYFKSKQDLIGAILDRHTLVRPIRGMISGLRDDMGLEEMASDYVHALFRLLEQNNDLIVMIFGEAQREPEIRARLAAIVSEGAKPLAAILARKENLDEAEMTHAVRNLQFAVVQYYLIFYRTHFDAEDRDRYLRETARQFVSIVKR